MVGLVLFAFVGTNTLRQTSQSATLRKRMLSASVACNLTAMGRAPPEWCLQSVPLPDLTVRLIIRNPFFVLVLFLSVWYHVCCAWRCLVELHARFFFLHVLCTYGSQQLSVCEMQEQGRVR